MSKYNPNMIQEIAEKVAELMNDTLSNAEHIGEVEKEMRTLLQTIGHTSLQRLLEQKGQPQGKEIACECGGSLKYQRQTRP